MAGETPAPGSPLEPLPVPYPEEVVIALYLRLGACLMHHPDDLPAYLAAWPRWKGALERC
jgi:hypothetical protein